MAQDDKNKPPKGSKPKITEEDLDKTVLDVDLRNFDLEDEKEDPGLDETVMIRVPPPDEDSDLHDTQGFGDEEDTGSHVQEEVVKPVTEPEQVPEIKPTQGKSTEKSPKPIAPAVQEPLHPVARHHAVHFSWGSFFLSLVVWILLLAGLLEALRTGGALRLPAILTAGFSGLVLLGALLRRWDSSQAFLWVLASWFSYVAYAGFYLPTAATPYFLNFSLEDLYGPFAILASLGVGFFILRSKQVSLIAKLLAMVGVVAWILAWVLSLIQNQSLEGSLWGPNWLGGLPLALRPAVVAMSWAFPLLGVAVLIAFFGWRKDGKTLFRGPILPLLLICFVGTMTSTKLLARQGWNVPLIQKVSGENFLGTTLVDSAQSAVRVIVSQDKPELGSDNRFQLTLAAGIPTSKYKSKQSYLMVRNVEGRSFVNPNLSKYLFLVRGEKLIKGGKLNLEKSRLGLPRHLGVVVDVPSLVKTEVRQSLFSALMHLGDQLDGIDRVYLMIPSGSKIINSENKSKWPKIISEILNPEGPSPADALTQSFKSLASQRGLKQIIYITEVAKLPPAANRQDWVAQATKGKVGLSFVVLGKVGESDTALYEAASPAGLGFQVLSSAAESLGDYLLEFPQLPPLPKIRLTRNSQDQVELTAGKLSFDIEAANPEEILSIQLKIDNNAVIDLDPKIFQQEIELVGQKIKPGMHQFSILLTTEAGDLVSESFEAQYVTRRSLQFIKPLDQDSVSGNINVLFSPARGSGQQTAAIELYVDGLPTGRSTTDPFLIPLDTSLLTPGEHSFQGVQFYTDGKSEAVEVKVQVNSSVPMVKMIRPSNGEFLSNVAEIEAEVGGGLLEQIQKVDYYVDGKWIGESTQAPHRFLWSNHSFPAGKYFLQARAQLESGAVTTDAVQVQLSQGEVVIQADLAQSPTGNLFPENVEILIDASVSMKEPLGPIFKLDFAKTALNEVMESIPQNVRLLTRVYGVGSNPAQKGCQDTLLLKNPREMLPGINANGSSNLAYALEQMGKDFQKAKGSRMGLLITDGWDRCGGDPIAIAQKFAKEKIKARLHVIYFATVSPTEQSLLKRLAEVTGGRSYVVRRPEDLISAIRDAAQVNFTLFDFKNSPVVNQPLSDRPFFIRTGDYRLEVDTVPPIQMNSLAIPAGGRKTLIVESAGEGYQLHEGATDNPN